MNRGLLYRRVVDPILELMSQGLTPEKIALSLAFGIVLGVFPMLGSTTILCAVAALISRLNLRSIRLVNYLIYPLQFLLLIPFLRLGEKLFHAAPLQLSVAQMLAMAHADLRHAIANPVARGLHAMSAWLLIGPFAIWLLYFLLSRALRDRRLGRATRHGQSGLTLPGWLLRRLRAWEDHPSLTALLIGAVQEFNRASVGLGDLPREYQPDSAA